MVNNWNVESLEEEMKSLVINADTLTTKISAEITNADENLKYIEKLFMELLEKHPKAVTNIYRERLMTAILQKRYSEALLIAEERIAVNDKGGFIMGDKSFFQCAKAYIQRISTR